MARERAERIKGRQGELERLGEGQKTKPGKLTEEGRRFGHLRENRGKGDMGSRPGEGRPLSRRIRGKEILSPGKHRRKGLF